MEITVTMRSEMPCQLCDADRCEEQACCRWRQWFLDGWAAIHRYAWDHMDRKGRQRKNCFTYELPHMVKSPCEGCPCSSWCDIPCALRLKWWDEGMDALKRRMSHGTDTKTEPVC